MAVRLSTRIFGGNGIGVPAAGIALGAVYNPAEVTVPDTADQEVAPGAVNCSVAPSTTVTCVGAIAGAAIVSVTAAVDCPLEFLAVTVSVPPAGIAVGAVYKPAEVTVPDTADQDVAPAALNCSVAPSTTA